MSTLVTVRPDEVERLVRLLALTKSLASPQRLAIVGALAARPAAMLTPADLAAATGQSAARLGRDLRQLAEAGVIRVETTEAEASADDALPARVGFDRDFLALMPQLIAALASLTGQLHPAAPKPALDDRAKTLARFLRDGQLTGWPVQPKRQRWLLDEIVERFATDRRYAERDVDAVLKQVNPSDHCTVRRALVDADLLRRADGEYWRPAPAATPSTESCA